MMEPGERLAVVYLDSIDERLLDDSTSMTGCTTPWLPSLGDRGSCTFYQYRPGHSALERLLEMVTSACDGRHGPDRRHDVGDRWLPERLTGAYVSTSRRRCHLTLT